MIRRQFYLIVVPKEKEKKSETRILWVRTRTLSSRFEVFGSSGETPPEECERSFLFYPLEVDDDDDVRDDEHEDEDDKE